jgi:hypothetical protein
MRILASVARSRRRGQQQRSPAISHHTKALADADLIIGQKAGKWVNWSVVADPTEQLPAALAP